MKLFLKLCIFIILQTNLYANYSEIDSIMNDIINVKADTSWLNNSNDYNYYYSFISELYPNSEDKNYYINEYSSEKNSLSFFIKCTGTVTTYSKKNEFKTKNKLLETYYLINLDWKIHSSFPFWSKKLVFLDNPKIINLSKINIYDDLGPIEKNCTYEIVNRIKRYNNTFLQ